MTIKEALAYAEKKIIKISDSADLDAEILLAYITKRPKEFLLAHPENELTKKEIVNFRRVIKRRRKGEPVAFITGKKEFYGLEFIIRRGVLVPRPETELLVEEVIKNSRPKSKICDVGTGSGCIAIALAKSMPKSKIVASDIDDISLRIAKENAKLHEVSSRIKFKKSNLLKSIYGKFDIIVANLPYLPNRRWGDLPTDIKRYESFKALLGGRRGFELYLDLLQQAVKKLKRDGIIYMEIDPSYINRFALKIKILYPNVKIKVKKDLAKRPRLFVVNL
ncbi:MAG: peptide chain release factor N(5)-glutamine methyltransferase [bacterium]